MFHRMIVKTETLDSRGKAQTSTEQIRHIPTSQIETRREAARQSAPRGATRTIKVVSES